MKDRTIDEIVAEMRNPPNRDEICPWWADGGDCVHCPLGKDGKNCPFDKFADRIEAACQREAALLIPAKNIEFFDGHVHRLIASGWVKKGGAE